MFTLELRHKEPSCHDGYTDKHTNCPRPHHYYVFWLKPYSPSPPLLHTHTHTHNFSRIRGRCGACCLTRHCAGHCCWLWRSRELNDAAGWWGEENVEESQRERERGGRERDTHREGRGMCLCPEWCSAQVCVNNGQPPRSDHHPCANLKICQYYFNERGHVMHNFRCIFFILSS